MSGLRVVAITPGEPAGIGPDLVPQLAGAVFDSALVFVADGSMLAQRAERLKTPLALKPWPGRSAASAGCYLADIAVGAPVTTGRLDTHNAAYVLRTLERAADGCLAGEFDALVTGPVQKSVINDAGIAFSGHTEFLAARAGAPLPVMMLASGTLRVALVTTHLPLADVSRTITLARLTQTIEVLHHDLRARFNLPQPRIAVCGLNPHAGESGHLGREEIEVIEPVLHRLRAEGMHLTGPVPADTAFTPARLAECDAVLAMYHDQGLPVIKHHDFAHAVNITLGLPFVRTSVDHGTALDLAGTGRADPSSFIAALEMALRLVRR